MHDIIEKIGASVLQHGALNNRIYLIKLDPGDAPGLIPRLDAMAGEKGYDKIFAKIPADLLDLFQAGGYRKEALIPGFFAGRVDGVFICKYFSEDRRREKNAEEILAVKARVEGWEAGSKKRERRTPYEATPLGPSDADEICRIYREVFPSYPFPIHDPEYVKIAMEEGVRYFSVREGGCIVAAAAAELDEASRNSEMTDFATLPEWRGRGMGGVLLARMDNEARKLGMRTAYTIARANSLGMNGVFKKNGYSHGGFLTNNTHISGNIQTMAVWYKRL
ncbi:MAG: putative beta-lysine N-acetyltransferase [Desulfobacterales bacterium]|nr:putative beta-lysine N-acetyltransferase [Desulfobacterales bacterium]